MSHPYRQQPPRAFWKRTVSGHHPMDIGGWYEKRFSLEGAKIATAGSCFAQHIGRNLRNNGFAYLDAEPAPETLPENVRLDYGYGMYSARYGNVYTSRQLLQLGQRALGRCTPCERAWEHKGGIVDPFRPTIEAEPFGSVAEMEALRETHLEAVAQLLHDADVFVFTLGLTEAWLSREDGAAFPLCPGTAGGVFAPARHALHNLTAAETRADMDGFIQLARAVNPNLRLLLTVSPVPLMATATTQQVAVATTYSKSVLRAVAGELYDNYNFVDYFPSYEIVTSPVMQGFFYEPDAREVSPHGVAHVMNVFFSQHKPDAQITGGGAAGGATPESELSELEKAERVKCDEELLNAFAGGTTP